MEVLQDDIHLGCARALRKSGVDGFRELEVHTVNLRARARLKSASAWEYDAMLPASRVLAVYPDITGTTTSKRSRCSRKFCSTVVPPLA